MTNIEVRPGVRLRPWAWGDEASLVRHANSWEVARWLRDVFPHPYTEDHARDWIRRVATAMPVRNWAIEVDGEPVGGIGLHAETAESVELGYWLGESHWGRGITSAAVAAVARFVFEEIGVSRLEAMTLPDNARSAGVLLRNGFVEVEPRELIARSGAPVQGRAFVLTRP